MKTEIVLVCLLLLAAHICQGQTLAERTEPRPSEIEHTPVGALGYPLGSYLRIEGTVPGPEVHLKGRTEYLLVDTVSGHKLAKPIAIFVSAVLPEGKRCVFNGYERGAWGGGTPPEVSQFEPDPKRTEPQMAWSYFGEFAITSVVQPPEFKPTRDVHH